MVRGVGSSVPSTVENRSSDRFSSWCEGIDASDQDEGGGNSDADGDEGVTEAKAATEQCEGRSHGAQEKGHPYPPRSPPSDCSLDVHSAAELPGEGGQLTDRQQTDAVSDRDRDPEPVSELPCEEFGGEAEEREREHCLETEQTEKGGQYGDARESPQHRRCLRGADERNSRQRYGENGGS